MIGSAVVPTLIAQRWFLPEYKPVEDVRAPSIAGQETFAPIAVEER